MVRGGLHWQCIKDPLEYVSRNGSSSSSFLKKGNGSRRTTHGHSEGKKIQRDEEGSRASFFGAGSPSSIP
ncbi:hypothetical protein CRE_24859 [Caenorhabditis remanei]|uniref:Uncharacterized protein n=1 Tax=Caenorhabditis remanei TaxID=31234 RepID=E3NLP7_CAERE|nr:hypothetical protein CRE_24859 [Caenorhabditis remanei]